MMARWWRSRARRHGRLAMLVAAAGGFSSGGSAACDPLANGGLGQGRFSYVCAATGSDPTQPDPDAWCETHTTATIPDVAVGAPVQLQTDRSSSGGPRPALAALAQSTANGWSLVQPGWLGFVAWSGANVSDFIHVRARPIASLGWQPTPTNAPLVVGSPAVALAVVPLADDGTTLGGAITCTFAVSDPAVVGVAGAGRVARVVALSIGDVTLTASCLGGRTQVTLYARSAADASVGGQSADGGDALAPNGEGGD